MEVTLEMMSDSYKSVDLKFVGGIKEFDLMSEEVKKWNMGKQCVKEPGHLDSFLRSLPKCHLTLMFLY